MALSPPVLVTSVLLKPKRPVATTGERFLSFPVDFSPLQTKGMKAGRLSLWQQDCVPMAVHIPHAGGRELLESGGDDL